MLKPFAGEFLVSPLPLELSLNACSHKCSFCFALLNDPDRKANVKAITNLLADYQERQTITAVLLKERYPVLISNRVDPLAASNYQQAIPIIRTLTELEIPVSIQSRGGQGLDELLSFLPPSVWYLSINQTDDGLRRKIEPGAPTIESRLLLCERLTKLGHHVLIGLNPLVPEWIPEPESLLRRLQHAGARGVWIQTLHFNQRHLRNMSAPQKAEYAPGIIKRALRSNNPANPDIAHARRAYEAARALGLRAYCTNIATVTDFFDSYREVYPKTFPVFLDYLKLCFEQLPDGGLLGFDDFADWACWQMPAGRHYLRDYIGSVARQMWSGEVKMPSSFTFRQLLEIIWQENEMPHCPVNYEWFAWYGKPDPDEPTLYTDEQCRMLYVFNPHGFPEHEVVSNYEEKSYVAAA